MDLKITPNKLEGEISVPPSKSVAHRMVITASLSKGVSTISNLYPSADILATMNCMRALGAKIDFSQDTAVIEGITDIPNSAVLDCCESGSTLRFLIPVACALGVKTEFIGSGLLPQRPITPLIDELPNHGITFNFSKAEGKNTLPCSVLGKLSPGKYSINGSVSSQFITGLLFALPILSGDSEIYLTSHLESRPYVDITIGVLRDFGCEISCTDNGFLVRGNQTLRPFSGKVEGDYSQSAFFYVANVLGSSLDIKGLNTKSLQGDKKIVEICNEAMKNGKAFSLDCSDIPDLVPVLTVLACFLEGKSEIYNVARLRIKECDRLAAMEDCLNRVGGNVKAYSDRIQIEGVNKLSGGEVQCYNDHRIAMSMAIAATICDNPIILHGAECVRKSFPDYFDVFRHLGGIAEEI